MLYRGSLHLLTLHARILVELARRPAISQERLAHELQVTMRTVQRHLNELESEGYVRVDRGQRPFSYDIDWSRTWPDIPWLRMISVHPGSVPAYSALSDLSLKVYQAARERGDDPGAALQSIVDDEAMSSVPK